jgi:chemotaxis protein MotB
MGKKPKIEERPVDSFTPMYVALMILLMAFFIVLNSMAVPSQENKRKVIDSLIGTFGVPKGGQLFSLVSETVTSSTKELEPPPPTEDKGNNYIPKIIDKIKKHAMAEYMDFSVSGMNVEISIDSKVTFRPGDDTLKEGVYPILNAIADKALETNCSIMIEGHTDGNKISSARFPSNWELSSYRANAVMRYLIEKRRMHPLKLAAFGYAHSRPLVPNDTAANRDKNRRVQILLLGVGAKTTQTGLKSWWERIGFTNPFDSKDGE